IMDGRDIGTVVLPDADIKIFLTATDEDRAQRRYEELALKGQTVTFEKVLNDMRVRDAQDSSRACAPLVPAPDAIKVDTTGNTLEQSVELLKQIIAARLGE
ncbi:MAG: (d)CMP kinase, partial [Oscillospiraceae bacterium]|nr:(d)CMP kinase [Oscillospiraceae bacterium]